MLDVRFPHDCHSGPVRVESFKPNGYGITTCRENKHET
jgi:hypothetical protein